MKKPMLYALAISIIGFGLIQLIPVNLSNPPASADIPASLDVKAILKRACYDCHSNETVWPWYSRVAPLSWLIAWDVKKGRGDLNFSTWARYSQEDQSEKVKESWKEVQEGQMPPWFYLPLHPDAALSKEDRLVLQDWASAYLHAGRSDVDGDEEGD